MKCRITDDAELKEAIYHKCLLNQEKYGARYCPCVNPEKYSSPEHEDYICMCKDFLENTPAGEWCHCGLYLKTEM